jgi:hypothetical protein
MRLLQGCRSDAGPICAALMVVFVCVPALANDVCLGVPEQVKAGKAWMAALSHYPADPVGQGGEPLRRQIEAIRRQAAW